MKSLRGWDGRQVSGVLGRRDRIRTQVGGVRLHEDWDFVLSERMARQGMVKI